MRNRAQSIIDFWFGVPGTPGFGRDNPLWFAGNADFDDEIRKRFSDDHLAAEQGRLDDWQQNPASALALILLLDQFPRNMFRGSPRAFACDPAARAAADRALERGYDRIVPGFTRKFLYMPYMHSEDPADQRRSLSLFEQLGEPASLKAARRHLEIVARFGRFPHRNAALGRTSSHEEATFLQEPDSSF